MYYVELTSVRGRQRRRFWRYDAVDGTADLGLSCALLVAEERVPDEEGDVTGQRLLEAAHQTRQQATTNCVIRGKRVTLGLWDTLSDSYVPSGTQSPGFPVGRWQLPGSSADGGSSKHRVIIGVRASSNNGVENLPNISDVFLVSVVETLFIREEPFLARRQSLLVAAAAGTKQMSAVLRRIGGNPSCH